MPAWEPFEMGGTAAWPLAVVLPGPAVVNVVIYEVTPLTTTEDA